MVHPKKVQNSANADNIINLIDNNKFDNALVEIRKLKKEPEYIIDFLLGYRQLRLGYYDKAVKYLEKSISSNPTNLLALVSLSIVYKELGQFDYGLDCAEQVLIFDPNNVVAKYLRAVCLVGLGSELNKKKAQTSLEQLFFELIDGKDPNLELVVDVLCSWGAVLLDLQCYEKSKMVLEKALAIRPFDTLANQNMASVFLHLGDPDSAKKNLETASISGDPEVLYQLSMVELMLGNFIRGWRMHESRLVTRRFKDRDLINSIKQIPFEELTSGSRVLLFQEQGIGDTLQFSRYIPLVYNKTKNIDIMLKPNHYMRLRDYVVPSIKDFIVDNYKEIDKIYVKGVDNIELQQYDAIIPLMSLPYIFKTSLDNIPSIRAPYITNAKKTLEIPKGTIGLFWYGSSHFQNDVNRSIPNEYINDFIGNNLNKQFVSLQLEGLDGIDDFTNIINAKLHMRSIGDTINIIEQCDIIITVDSMMAHLSAGISKPTWILQSKSCDWRWGKDAKDSIWYPTITNFRQSTLGDWVSVLDSVTKELQK